MWSFDFKIDTQQAVAQVSTIITTKDGNWVDGTIDLGAYEYVGNYQTPNAGPITVSGSASSGNPARLTATATGQSFVFTGPNGYVFSNVYLTPGSYGLFAPNVQTPGLYTVTVYGSPGCPSASNTVTVY
jgi:hypothetical protein